MKPTDETREAEISGAVAADDGGLGVVVSGGVDDVRVLLVAEARRRDVSSARLVELETKIARATSSTRAVSTLGAYRSDWEDFMLWCDDLGLVALPAQPATVAAYVAELAEPPDDRPPRALSTIRRRLASISEAHKLAGYGTVNPVGDVLVRETMKGLRRILGAATAQKKGVSTADIRAVVSRLGVRLIDHRDRAVLLVGFAGGFRRSELAGLTVEDLEDHPEGLLVHVRQSKTDQDRVGRRVEIVWVRLF